MKKKLLSLCLAFAMVLTLAGSAFAVDSSAAEEGNLEPPDFTLNTYFNHVPDDIVTVSASALAGATAAANTPVLSILGINVTSTDAPGTLNYAADPDWPMNLLVFGSDLNENPDPYLSNFYYNLGTIGYPGDEYSINNYTDNGWTGAYTLLNYAKQGPSGSASGSTNYTIDIDIFGTVENTNPVFFYEPQILMGGSEDAYLPGLETYHVEVDPDYCPITIGNWTTSAYCINDGTFESTVAMANGVYEDAVAIQDYLVYLADMGIELTSRYNDIVTCGAKYSNFAMGIWYYAQSQFAGTDEEGNPLLQKVTYAINIEDNGDGTYTVTPGTGRIAQYADGLGTELASGDQYTLDDFAKTLDYYITSDSESDVAAALESVGVNLIDTSEMPTTVYGMTMQAPDNILGVPYFFSRFYSDQLAARGITLTEGEVTAYFAKNIYHITNEGVRTIVDAMYGFPEYVDSEGNHAYGVPVDPEYNNIVYNMILQGANYYYSIYDHNGNWDAANDNHI